MTDPEDRFWAISAEYENDFPNEIFLIRQNGVDFYTEENLTKRLTEAREGKLKTLLPKDVDFYDAVIESSQSWIRQVRWINKRLGGER